MTDVESILRAVDALREQIVTFTQRLVQFKSVNPVFPGSVPLEEKACQEFIADKLRSLGFQGIDLWEPDPVLLSKYKGRPGFTENRTFRDRPNLVARLRGTGGGKSVFLTGHVDVVGADPRTEAWEHDPFAGVVKHGQLHGRGTVDMKAGIASMIMAVEALQQAKVTLAGDILVGTVVDEETGSMGMLSLVDRGYRADAGIMTEPTDLRVAPICRGVIWGRIKIRGKSGHIEISQPHWSEGGAVDALAKGLIVIDGIKRLNEEWAQRPDKRHPLLPRPCQVNVSMVHAGQHPSSYPENCEITVDIQYLPSECDLFGLGGDVKREVESFLLRVAQSDPWLKEHPPVFEWFVDADCAEVPVEHPIVTTLRKAAIYAGISKTIGCVEAHTDMSLLTKMAQTPTVNFGPGLPSIAHQTNEYVEVEDLILATKTIALAIAEWCK